MRRVRVCAPVRLTGTHAARTRTATWRCSAGTLRLTRATSSTGSARHPPRSSRRAVRAGERTCAGLIGRTTAAIAAGIFVWEWLLQANRAFVLPLLVEVQVVLPSVDKRSAACDSSRSGCLGVHCGPGPGSFLRPRLARDGTVRASAPPTASGWALTLARRAACSERALVDDTMQPVHDKDMAARIHPHVIWTRFLSGQFGGATPHSARWSQSEYPRPRCCSEHFGAATGGQSREVTGVLFTIMHKVPPLASCRTSLHERALTAVMLTGSPDVRAARTALRATLRAADSLLADASGWVSPPEAASQLQVADTARGYSPAPSPRVRRPDQRVGREPAALARVQRGAAVVLPPSLLVRNGPAPCAPPTHTWPPHPRRMDPHKSSANVQDTAQLLAQVFAALESEVRVRRHRRRPNWRCASLIMAAHGSQKDTQRSGAGASGSPQVDAKGPTALFKSPHARVPVQPAAIRRASRLSAGRGLTAANRSLLLLLCGHERDRIAVWHNPRRDAAKTLRGAHRHPLPRARALALSAAHELRRRHRRAAHRLGRRGNRDVAHACADSVVGGLCVCARRLRASMRPRAPPRDYDPLLAIRLGQRCAVRHILSNRSHRC
jgi:hypothetical protein